MRKSISALLLVFSVATASAQMKQSSFTATSDTKKSLVSGAGVLYKVMVTSPGASSTIEFFDADGSTFTTPGVGSSFGKFDSSALRDTTLNVFFSSGLTYTSVTPAQHMIVYKRGARKLAGDVPVWISTHAFATTTAQPLFSGRGILHKIILNNGEGVASNLKIYDSTGSVITTPVLFVNGTAELDQQYDINLSTGLTYTTGGTGDWNIIYEVGAP